MEYIQYDDGKAFLDKVESFLLKHEAVNNLPLGLLYEIARGSDRYVDPFLSIVKEDDEPILVMVMTPPQSIVLYGEGPNVFEAIPFAVKQLIDSGIQVPGVVGPNQLSWAFAEEWKKATNQTFEIKMRQRIYKLEKVNDIDYANGSLRAATKEDLPLVAQWMYDFTKVTMGAAPYEKVLANAERGITDKTIYLWEDGKPVSMVRKVRPSKHGIVISYVYTPPEQTRKGYASACVAAFSQLLLDEGYNFCALYTDLDNPTSNSIYMKIGYEPVEDSMMYIFNKG